MKDMQVREVNLWRRFWIGLAVGCTAFILTQLIIQLLI